MAQAEVTRARRGQRMAWEFGLAVLVAAVSGGVVGLSFDPAWGALDCSAGSAWFWGLFAGMVGVGLARLWFPATALVGAALFFALWPVAGGLLALTAFHAAGHVRPERRLRIAVLVAVLADVGAALLAAQYGWTIVLAGHAAALLLCVGLPIGVQVLLGKADRLVAALRERAHYLEDNYRLAHSAARLQERSRIAQEMHDQLGHRLSLISLYAGALELATAGGRGPGGGPAGADEARLIRGTVRTAMEELRLTLGMLRSADPAEPLLQPVEQTGTRTDLALLVAESRSAGVRVELTWHGADLADAPLPARRAAHRLVREGLTNIHRHAPGADAEVLVDHRPGWVRIEVSSVHGVPPGPAPRGAGTGLGLVGVQERVRLLGGAFLAGTIEGGFRVLAELPLDGPGGPGGRPPAVEESVAPPVPGTRVSRAVRRRLDGRRGIAAVLVVGLIGIPAVLSAVLNGVSLVVPGSSPYDGPTESVRIGMTRAEVLSHIGTEDSLARLAAGTIETPRPAAATCLYSRDWDEAEHDVILRFCFRGDRLSTLDRFPVPDGE